jgi:hypothetical protein
MARVPRITAVGDPTAYHVISNGLSWLPISDMDKDSFVNLMKRKRRGGSEQIVRQRSAFS